MFSLHGGVVDGLPCLDFTGGCIRSGEIVESRVHEGALRQLSS
jgi:hypothetical protein